MKIVALKKFTYLKCYKVIKFEKKYLNIFIPAALKVCINYSLLYVYIRNKLFYYC